MERRLLKGSLQGQIEEKHKRWIVYGIGAAVALGAVALILLIAFALAGAGAGGAPSLPWGKGCVGVIGIKGELTTEEVPEGFFSSGVRGSESISEVIEEAGKRDDVKSLLVVVDSPGGSVVASREIYEALKRVNKSKVAYFREVAASGGYYVGMGTDYIVSDPDAITGSIGVRATVVEMSGLFEKVGMNMSTVASGKHKDMGDIARPMTDEERVLFQALVDEIFGEFRDVVLASRGGRLNRAEFEKVLDGRIVTGRQAKKIGLVDEVGNKRRALEKAAELGGVEYDASKGEEPAVCELGKGGGGFGDVFSSAAFEAGKMFGKGLSAGLEPRVQIS